MIFGDFSTVWTVEDCYLYQQITIFTTPNLLLMKKFYLYLLLTTFCYNSFSQSKLDSLKKVLAKLPPEGRSFAGDTLRVRVLCEMGEVNSRFETGSDYYVKAIEKAKLINWTNGEMRATNKLGVLNTLNGNLFKGIDYLTQSLNLSIKLKNTSMQALNYRYMGDAFLRMNRLNNAIKYYNYAIQMFGDDKNYSGKLLSLNNLSLVYKEAGDYKKSISVLKSCKLLNAKEVKRNVFDLYIYNNIADNYYYLNQLDSALYYFNNAEYQFYNVLKNSERKKNYIAIITFGKSQVYFKKKQIIKAIEYSENALKFNSSIDKGLMIKVYKQLSILFEQKNLYKQSLNYHQRYEQLKDSVDNLDFNRRLSLINSEFNFEKEKNKNQNLKNEIYQKEITEKYLWISLSLFIIFLISVGIYSILLRRKNIEIRDVKNDLESLNNLLELKVEERTSELFEANQELMNKNRDIMEALFKGQSLERKRVASELHDNLGSTLSALKWRLDALDSNNLNEKERKIYEGIVSMMKSAYTDVRNISHNLLPNRFEEEGLIGSLRRLIDDINLSGDIHLSIKLETDISNLSNNVALEIYSICLEIINNILKHSKSTNATIVIRSIKEYISIMIDDDGVGFDSKLTNNGVGLRNISERVNSLNGTLKLESELGKGTKYLILIPMLDSMLY